jgi:hypothetical protein
VCGASTERGNEGDTKRPVCRRFSDRSAASNVIRLP